MPEVISQKRAVLALLLMLINSFVLTYPMVANGIQALGAFAGGFAAFAVSFISLYVGLFLARLVAGWGKIDIAV